MSEDSTTVTDGETQALGGDTPLVDPGPEWMGSLSEELQTNNGLTKFKDVDGLAKSYLELEKSNSSKFGVPEKDDSEGWDKLYNKLGRPEKAEDYSLEGIENEELASVEENKATIDRFKEIGHQYGLNNRQVAGIINDVLGMTAEQARASSEVNSQNIQELREAFGPEFDNRVALANDTLKKMVDLGLVDETAVAPGITFKQMMGKLVGAGDGVAGDVDFANPATTYVCRWGSRTCSATRAAILLRGSR